MDEGRRWSIEMFGAEGVNIRERVIELVQKEHNASVDAQEASGHRSRGVYGQFWRGILERFEDAFKDLPHVKNVRPGRAPYSIPVVNGTAIFPWRYGNSRDEDLSTKNFATSDARKDLFQMIGLSVQNEFDLGIEHPELNSDEVTLAEYVQSIFDDGESSAVRVVVVAVSSSPLALFDLQWGEAGIGDDGSIIWGFKESLLELNSMTPLSVVGESKNFQTGEVPEMRIRLQSDAKDDESGPTKAGDE